MEYHIKYNAHNSYENTVNEAHWQFLIVPEQNETQVLHKSVLQNSLGSSVQESANGFGFRAYRIHPRTAFKDIHFKAEFWLDKRTVNPFAQIKERDVSSDLDQINSLEFKVEHEPFLKSTSLTQLPDTYTDIYIFDGTKTLFENILNLNTTIFKAFSFRPDVTTIDTNLREIIEKKEGVCQDFTHLFCALSRKQKIPTRYVSGYLHQGQGYQGDSQMHAWAECFLPGMGWMGFDPTNNLIAAENHIKVSHGKDYTDCPPIKGVVYNTGGNTTTYNVEVRAVNDSAVMSQTQHEGKMQQQMAGMTQGLKPMEPLVWGSVQQQQQQ